MLQLSFHPDVSSELKSSYQWYQKQAHGLGDDFILELEKSFDTILNLPDTWPIFHKYYRRFLLSKFPFSIIYRLDDDCIYAVAVMHNSRKPYYWLERI